MALPCLQAAADDGNISVSLAAAREPNAEQVAVFQFQQIRRMAAAVWRIWNQRFHSVQQRVMVKSPIIRELRNFNQISSHKKRHSFFLPHFLYQG